MAAQMILAIESLCCPVESGPSVDGNALKRRRYWIKAFLHHKKGRRFDMAIVPPSEKTASFWSECKTK